MRYMYVTFLLPTLSLVLATYMTVCTCMDSQQFAYIKNLSNSQRKRQSCEHLAQEVRITLKTLNGYTYNCTEEHQDILIDLHDRLQKLTEEFKSKLPQQDGLLLRPQVRKRLKLSLQKKVSKGTKPLPSPSKRGRKKQSSDYRNRVGRKAQSLRKVNLHDIVHVLCT